MQTNIKKQLHAKNMTAAELERRTGIPHAVINILHGRSKNPSIRTAQAIAKELGCSVEELISEPTKPVNAGWNAQVYRSIFEAVYNCIQTKNIRPEPKLVSECITEAYTYTIGSPNQTVDLRFIEWLIAKTCNNSLG